MSNLVEEIGVDAALDLISGKAGHIMTRGNQSLNVETVVAQIREVYHAQCLALEEYDRREGSQYIPNDDDDDDDVNDALAEVGESNDS